MAREGQTVQTDGSRHQWFGPDHPYATLIGVVAPPPVTMTHRSARRIGVSSGSVGIVDLLELVLPAGG
jgi:hypothetical protein